MISNFEKIKNEIYVDSDGITYFSANTIKKLFNIPQNHSLIDFDNTLFSDEKVMEIAWDLVVKEGNHKALRFVMESFHQFFHRDSPYDEESYLRMASQARKKHLKSSVKQEIKDNKRRKRSRESLREKNEFFYQQMLLMKLGGQTEVSTPSGKIDLLTDEHLIEIKEIRSWKCGIGQLMAYGIYYPNHKKSLFLFNVNSANNLENVHFVCKNLGINILS